MSLPPIAGALTTACAAVAALTTVIAFAALGSTGTAVLPRPNPNAPRLWKPRTPPVASAPLATPAQREIAPATRACLFLEPLAMDGDPVVRVLGLPLGLVRVPVTASALGESAAPSCQAQRSERECERPCGSRFAREIE